MNNNKWGQARIEFLSVISEIQNMLDQGSPKKAIYRLLISERKISMSYCRFCQLIEKKFDQKYTNKRIKNKDLKIESCVHKENSNIRDKKNLLPATVTQQKRKAFGAKEEDTEPREPRINNKNI